jgi:SAM-dependent methyltransferase
MPTNDPLASNTVWAIRRYYDQNTKLFLSLGSSPEAQTIHRALWAAGVTTLAQALNTSNELVLRAIHQLAQQRGLQRVCVADLGCGVGASLFYLLQKLDLPARGVGLTISHVQAQLAARMAAQHAHQLPNLPHFIEADFQAVPLAQDFDVAYSIEAFVHAPQPQRYLQQVARILKPGGRLVLIDDFLAGAGGQNAPEAVGFWLREYQRGWHVPNLRRVNEIEAMAADYGLRLILQRTLTPLLRLRAMPNALAQAIVRAGQKLPQRHAIVPSLLGSIALQQCLKMGLIGYQQLLFER